MTRKVGVLLALGPESSTITQGSVCKDNIGRVTHVLQTQRTRLQHTCKERVVTGILGNGGFSFPSLDFCY